MLQSDFCDVEAAILEERNAEMLQIEHDMTILAEVYADLASLVDVQGESIDRLVHTTEAIVVNVEQGTRALCAAEQYDDWYRTKLFRGALVSGGVAVGGVALGVVFSPIIGVIATGCGVIGTASCLGLAANNLKNKTHPLE